MENSYCTEQEQFWAGDFGTEYISRNPINGCIIPNRISLFSKIFSRLASLNSLIELGANIGLNLQAITTLMPNLEISGVEINSQAVAELKKIKNVKVYHESLLEFEPDYQRDLVLSCGFLIHIHPEKLPQVYDIMLQTSKKYIVIAEYYNPTPIEVIYRGHQNKLFKRDFAGEIIDRFHNIKLIDYGFVYHRDSQFPLDDITWFLLEK